MPLYYIVALPKAKVEHLFLAIRVEVVQLDQVERGVLENELWVDKDVIYELPKPTFGTEDAER